MFKSVDEFEVKYKQTLSLFVEVVKELDTKSVDYMFIGFFANLAHNHFRSSNYFDIAVSRRDFRKLQNIFRECGLRKGVSDNRTTFSLEFLCFRIHIVYKSELLDRVSLNIVDCEQEMLLWFPSIDVHKRHLPSFGFFGEEDVRIIEHANLDVKTSRLNALFNQYLSCLHIRR